MLNVSDISQYFLISEEEFNSLKTLEKLSLLCPVCNTKYKRTKKKILQNLKITEYIPVCSNACRMYVKGRTLNYNCTHCNKEIKKSLGDSKKSKSNNHFCNSSCAASYNNKTPKRKIQRTCANCDELVANCKTSLCEIHLQKYKEGKFTNKTLGEYRNKPSLKDKHPSWVNGHIRAFARSWRKNLISLPCAKCGYSKHVELAHIKGVSTFDDNSLLSEVNSESNIIQLCPTCHWEFDNEPREIFKELLLSLNKIYSES